MGHERIRLALMVTAPHEASHRLDRSGTVERAEDLFTED